MSPLPEDLSRWPTDPYALLGVTHDVAPRDLKRAYTQLIRTYKPEHKNLDRLGAVMQGIWTDFAKDPSKAPGIYAPYQPRFDWNLWFASLGSWREYPIVLSTEIQLLSNDPDVLALFAGNPFPHEPPRQVRAVLWQYWFTTAAEKRKTGLWWRREFLGLYAPAIARDPDGRIRAVEWPMGARQ